MPASMPIETDLATNLAGDLRMVDALREGLSSCDEALFSVSFLRFSGMGLILEQLEQLGARGGRVRVITSTYMNITQPEALRELDRIEGVECRLHLAEAGEGFHPKFYLFLGERPRCWVGSSNLSRGGIALNVEANLAQRDTDGVARVRRLFETLWVRDDVVPLQTSLLEEYGSVFRRASRARTHQAWSFFRTSQFAPKRSSSGPSPNEAQREALKRLVHLREAGETRAAVVAAPGVGKTHLAAFDARASGADTILFVSHRFEHLEQARDTFGEVFAERAPSMGYVSAGMRQMDASMRFATIQSLREETLEQVCAKPIDYLILDEFHHASAASYQRLLERARFGFLLGLTGTPERADGQDVLESCDYNIAYEARVIEAIERGWLLPFHYFGIADELVDYDAIPWRSRRFDPRALDAALMLSERATYILAHARQKGFDGSHRVAVGFCASVAHARFMAREFRVHGEDALALTGQDAPTTRREVYERLASAEDSLSWLFVVDLLNEGVDIPEINQVLFLRPTESPTIFTQQLGRGLRRTPGCEVLTVLDFVGNHTSSWEALTALGSRRTPRTASTLEELELTPPPGCEILLDERTLEVMARLKKRRTTWKDRCSKVYQNLRDELGRPPRPLELWNLREAPSLTCFRRTYGDWIACRMVHGDATDWERALDEQHPARVLLREMEKNWQRQRPYAYALVWGLATNLENPAAGYERFFERFPRWKAEYAPLDETHAWKQVRKRLEEALQNDRLSREILEAFPDAETLREEVEQRLRHTLEGDYRTRHGGILRTPDEFELHAQYERPEIVNHFGVQYDPAVHNKGVLSFELEGTVQFAIITKLDTSDALETHQYDNGFVSEQRFRWQSQNRQRRDRGSGRQIADHRELEIPILLFVQPRSGRKAVYMGHVFAESIEGDEPMNVVFSLEHEPSAFILEYLGVQRWG